jgi:hypothetical protein
VTSFVERSLARLAAARALESTERPRSSETALPATGARMASAVRRRCVAETSSSRKPLMDARRDWHSPQAGAADLRPARYQRSTA